ncbi:MAG: 5-formyltetrahydrofolate cyclo-ligase [Desulfobulbaceae bacterium]|nr:5-formyltetrahydrofolate cyclo-ligase [Desulfobulbaceae bacterium]HIJ77784.1 5-formyltetrahydrofolate cyclo-ligase [Deltaproteobacteria bacterium]
MLEKQELRDEIDHKKIEFPFPAGGKLAEQIRRLAGYKEARCLFVSPAALLDQVRINALNDGKILIMPAPGLKEGFYRIKPYSIAFKDLKFAVTYKGLAQFGEHLLFEEMAGLAIDLFFTEILYVDPFGVFLGNGQGFFDLSVALLSELGGVADNARAYAVGVGEQLLVERLKHDCWDVPVNGLVSADGVTEFGQGRLAAAVYWPVLTERSIKKIAPLWRLACKQGKI